jgi:hypothetical protein
VHCKSGICNWQSCKPQACNDPDEHVRTNRPSAELGPIRGTDYPPVFEEDVEYVETVHRLSDYLSKGDHEAAMGLFDDSMKKAGDAAFWDRTWSQLQKQAGDFVKTGDSVAGRKDEAGQTYVIVHHTLVFSKSSLVQRTVLNLEGQVAGLFFLPGAVKLDQGGQRTDSGSKDAGQELALPDGPTETEVTIESQPGFPLQGSLTLPR